MTRTRAALIDARTLEGYLADLISQYDNKLGSRRAVAALIALRLEQLAGVLEMSWIARLLSGHGSPAALRAEAQLWRSGDRRVTR